MSIQFSDERIEELIKFVEEIGENAKIDLNARGRGKVADLLELLSEKAAQIKAEATAYLRSEVAAFAALAQLEKQRPLIEAALSLSEADAEMGETGELVRAALLYKEQHDHD